MTADCAPKDMREVANADYRTLQSYARGLDIPSGGKCEVLRMRVAKAIIFDAILGEWPWPT